MALTGVSRGLKWCHAARETEEEEEDLPELEPLPGRRMPTIGIDSEAEYDDDEEEEDAVVDSAVLESNSPETRASSSGIQEEPLAAGLASEGPREHSCQGLDKGLIEEDPGRGRGGARGLVGAVAAPVGWVARGAWHIGSHIVGRLL